MEVTYAKLDPCMRIVEAPAFEPEIPDTLGRAGMSSAAVAANQVTVEVDHNLAVAPLAPHALVLRNLYTQRTRG